MLLLPPMVNLLRRLPSHGSNEILADIEAEDVELSNNDDDLAVDVDEGILDEDPEALDSDDEQTGENVELGIETAEAESKQVCAALANAGHSGFLQHRCTSCLYTLFYQATSRCGYSKLRQPGIVSLSYQLMWLRLLLRSQVYVMSLIVGGLKK